MTMSDAVAIPETGMRPAQKEKDKKMADLKNVDQVIEALVLNESILKTPKGQEFDTETGEQVVSPTMAKPKSFLGQLGDLVKHGKRSKLSRKAAAWMGV